MATRKAGGRTTPRKLTAIEGGAVVMTDLDAEFDAEREAMPNKRVRIFGREWVLTAGPNIVAVNEMAQEDFDIVEHILSYIAEDERSAFHAELKNPTRSIGWDYLTKLSNRLAEIVASRPTERS